MKQKDQRRGLPPDRATQHGAQMQEKAQQRMREEVQENVGEEIQSFLLAVDSYPDRVAHEPGITFQQHLASMLGRRSSS